MNRLRYTWSALALAVMTGCATPEADQAPLSAADFGPFPSNHLEIFRSYLFSRLKDPFSAQIQHVGGPGTFVDQHEFVGGRVHGWGACYLVNAKNAFGAYVGWKQMTVVIRNGQIVTTYGDLTGRGSIYHDAQNDRRCRAVGPVASPATVGGAVR